MIYQQRIIRNTIEYILAKKMQLRKVFIHNNSVPNRYF